MPENWKCAKCGNTNPGSTEICLKCITQGSNWICEKCSNVNSTGVKVCLACNHSPDPFVNDDPADLEPEEPSPDDGDSGDELPD